MSTNLYNLHSCHYFFIDGQLAINVRGSYYAEKIKSILAKLGITAKIETSSNGPSYSKVYTLKTNLPENSDSEKIKEVYASCDIVFAKLPD